MDRLLVPLDSTSASHRAIRWADNLAEAFTAEVQLLRSITIEDQIKSLEAGWDISLRELPERLGRTELEEAATQFRHVKPVGSIIDSGDPGIVIPKHAMRIESTLIVMAGHGRSGLDRALFGSITAEVVYRSGIPVLSIGPNVPESPVDLPRRILAPLDGSPLAESILDPLGDFAGRLNASVVLFRALESREFLPIQGAMVPLRNPFHATTEQLGEDIEPSAVKLRERGLRADVCVRAGDPQHLILEAATDEHADLIALSTHGRRGGLVRMLAGSVAEHLIAHAHVPVLVYHPQNLPGTRVRARRGQPMRASGEDSRPRRNPESE